MPDTDFMTVAELAAVVKISASTIYRNPAKYHMFRVGGCWRANSESLKKFAEAAANDNNVFRLAVVGGKEKRKCRSTNGVKHSGSTYPLQTERELDALLAPRKRQKRSSCTTS